MTELRALPAPGALPRERYGLFLAVRRGLPLLVAAVALLAAAFHLEGRGWWMLACVAGLAAAWPTFLGGPAYLRSRSAIMRWDGLWALALRPLARWLGQEDAWILRVERRGYDLLLERIPWSISMVRLSWMKTVLIVQW